MSWLRFFLHCLLLLSIAAPLRASLAALPAIDGDGRPLPSLAPMLKQVMPAVVNIAANRLVEGNSNPLFDDPFFRHFFDLPAPRPRQDQSLGSGVIVDARNGYVLTNHHVIKGAEQVTVTLHDGRRLSAQAVGSDPESDIALIRIPIDGLTALPFADSARIEVGDFVVAIGHPFGLNHTVTSGIVSALGRSGLGIEGYEDFIQTDAPINPGNSGGALVNLRGELVGVNTAILAPGGGSVGIGFAIPANMLRDVMQELVAHGEVRRGYLGIHAQNLTPDLSEAFGLPAGRGAVITRVNPGTPAAEAGVRRGDVVLSIGEREIRDAAGLRNAIGLSRVGERLKIEILRDGKPLLLTAHVHPDSQAEAEGGTASRFLRGARLREVELAVETRGGDRIERFVSVVEVEPGSPAARTGLQPGDLLTGVNRKPVHGLDELVKAAGGSVRGLLLSVQRGQQSFLLSLQ